MLNSNTAVSESLDNRFSSEKGLYGKLEDIPLIAQKGHYRRMELLDLLAIGSVLDKVCVDFGTGSWGFAGIYPKLHACRFAYGLDISPKALELSARLSAEGNFPYGNHFEYLQSDGLDIPLPDESVDLIFAGESIEHVRLPMRFLSESHRVLRYNGQLVVTTPNRDALLYKAQDDLYCVGPEHFWLFNVEELKAAVEEFFDIQECLGFNGSIYRNLDKTTVDSQSTEQWAKLFLNEPEFASGIVLRATKKSVAAPKQYRIAPIYTRQIAVSGRSQRLDLEFGLKGTMIDDPQSKITFLCPPSSGLVMYFWTHAWSGHTHIRCGDRVAQFNLYTEDPGWKPIHFRLESDRNLPVEIRATGGQDRRALSPQVIFFEAFVYHT